MSCKTPSNNKSASHNDPFTNHLIHEKSPYLLQHAHNPVNWYPWGKQALDLAKKENKMLIISVGYAACHWCHVMEHESFEDTTVAQLMNDHFIAIKVDREERPDIDDVYMSACQLVSKRGCGWPLNAFALPDGRPVWAGTYFPKDNWIDVLNYFIQLQKGSSEKMERSAQQIVQGIRQMDAQHFNNAPSNISEDVLNEATRKLLSTRDLKLGGRRGQPKFPLPINYEFLLNQYRDQNDPSALNAVITTLDHMAKGGIYDQIGGGFSRYSTDSKWLVPHFEKMLYDNAQLISLYAHAYMVKPSPLYKKVIQNTIAFTERELRSSEGGFFASLDADSEGEEGKFYVWTQEEFNNAIGDDEMIAIATAYYDIKKNGNWEDGKNILHVVKNIPELAEKHNKTPEQITTIISRCNELLMAARTGRIRPGLDDKILTSWNSLMLSAYSDAYRALGDESYRINALKSLEFIRNEMLQPDGRLDRNYKDGISGINAFAEDYALFIKALMDIYEITFDEKHLQLAQKLTNYTIEHFLDEKDQMFYFTSDIDPALIHRNRVITDNVIPGSNSVMANNLHRLGILLDNNLYMQLSVNMLQKIAPQIEAISQPDYYANWCILYGKILRRPYEIAIVGPDYEAKRKAFQQHFTPNAVFLGGANEGGLELLKNKLIEDETFIYVCLNKVCKLPVKEVDRALELMD